MDERVLLRIGRVVKTHGVVGEILIAPDTENPDRILGLESVFLGNSASNSKLHEVRRSRIHRVKKHTGVVMALADVDSVDAARSLAGRNVYANEDDLPPLDDDEYYLDDLIGYHVSDSKGKSIGTVFAVVEYPGQVMLDIKKADGSTALVPLVVPHIVSAIDDDNGSIVIADVEGLIDD